MEHSLVVDALTVLTGVGVGYGVPRLVLEWTKRRIQRASAAPSVPVDPIVLAVQDAYTECGLPQHEFNAHFDLARTGKLNEVLHRAAEKLGKDHPLRTVDDVTQFLRVL